MPHTRLQANKKRRKTDLSQSIGSSNTAFAGSLLSKEIAAFAPSLNRHSLHTRLVTIMSSDHLAPLEKEAQLFFAFSEALHVVKTESERQWIYDWFERLATGRPQLKHFVGHLRRKNP